MAAGTGDEAHLVYLDAFVPKDGESLTDMIGPDFVAVFRERLHSGGEGWRLPPLPLEDIGIIDEQDLS